MATSNPATWYVVDRPNLITDKPLRITSCRRVVDSQVETPMDMLGYQEYFDMPMKEIQGVPTNAMYNPLRNEGHLYIWPTPESNDVKVRFTFERKLQDLDEAPDDFDFPQEWLEALTWQLAMRIAPAFLSGQALADVSGYIAPIASKMLEELLDWDAEITHVDIQPDLTPYR